MAITKTSTVSSSGASSVAMVVPTISADDWLGLSVATKTTAVLTITEDNLASWTLKERRQSTLTLTLWWRRAAVGTLGASTVHVNGGNSAMIGSIVGFTGVSTTGDAIEAVNSTVKTGSSGATMTALTVASSGAMVFFMAGEGDDRALSTMTAGGTPSSMATFTNNVTSVGSDASVFASGNVMASSGVTGTFSVTAAAAPVDNWALIAVALTPAGAGGGGPAPTVTPEPILLTGVQ